MFKKIFYFILFFVVIFIFTYGLSNNFFEQDEWGAFGDLQYSYSLPWWNFLISRGVHFSPLGFLYWSILYKIFGFQAQYYVFIELLSHAFLAFLIFVLSFQISKNKAVSLLTGFLFSVNGRADQAFMHLSSFNTTISSFIFIVLFFVYLGTIKQKKFHISNIAVLLVLFLIAVFFREEGILIVPLFLIYLFFFDKSKLNKKNIKQFLLLVAGLIVFFLLRGVSQMLNYTPVPVTSGDLISGALFYNFLTLPYKLITQNIISAGGIFSFLLDNSTRIYSGINLSFINVYPVFMDFAFFFFFVLILGIFLLWFFTTGDKKKFSYILFFTLWILFYSFILSFVGRRLYVIEERYLYFASFPVLFIFSYFLVSVFSSNSKQEWFNRLKKIFVIASVFLFMFTSYNEIQESVKYKTFNGQARKKFLHSVKEVKPKLSNDTVFYFQCKGKCYRNTEFGLAPEWVLPFSSGPGWNLLVMYSQGNEKTWGLFLRDAFLLDLNSQGYKRVGDRSFGYFIDKKLLSKTLKENALSKESVIALEYIEKDFTVRDISVEFRKTLNEN